MRSAFNSFYFQSRNSHSTRALATTNQSPAAASLCMSVGTWVACWALFTFAIVTAGWLTRNLLTAAAPGGALLAFATVWICQLRQGVGLRTRLSSIATVVAVVGGSVLLALTGHDFSVDGQTYHQQAILAMLDGWNPYRDPHYTGAHSLWLSHYTKAPWILSASLATTFGDIEAGKAASKLFVVASFCLAHTSLQTFGLRRAASTFCALLVAVNPVVVYQFQTYYFDGLLCATITIAAFSAWLLLMKPSLLAAITLAATLAFGFSIKFTAGPFMFVALAAPTLWSLYGARERARCLVLAISAGTIVGLILATNPLVSNLSDHGHPFYPLAGKGKVDILSAHAEEDLLSRNRFSKGMISLLSMSDNARLNERHLKWPGQVYASELQTVARVTDVHTGGFGPWASLAIFAVLAYILFVMTWQNSARTTSLQLAAVVIAGLLLSTVLMPEFWWARYAPQFWTALLLAAVVARQACISSSWRRVGTAVLCLFALNLAMVAVPVAAKRIVMELDYRAQLKSIKEISDDYPVMMEIVDDSARHRLRAAGIHFVEGITAQCVHIDHLRGSETVSLCIPARWVDRYHTGSPFVARLLGRSASSVLLDSKAK